MKTFNKVDLKLKALYRFKYNFILNCNVFSVRECVQSCGVSHTNLDETLAFADHKRSEVGGEPTIIHLHAIKIGTVPYPFRCGQVRTSLIGTSKVLRFPLYYCNS